MGVFTNIQAALNTRLNSLSGAPTIIWPNTKAQPVIAASWMRPTLLPATTTLHNLDGLQHHKGLYQIDIFVPVQGGLSTLTGYMDSVLSHFKGQSLTANSDTVHIQAVSVGATERQDSWFRGFVEIYYICYS